VALTFVIREVRSQRGTESTTTSAAGRLVRYLLTLRNGLPATPAAFVTSRSDWRPGDLVATRAGSLRILEIDPELDPELRGDFDGAWVVERVAPDAAGKTAAR
jgi:hypothetical protein